MKNKLLIVMVLKNLLQVMQIVVFLVDGLILPLIMLLMLVAFLQKRLIPTALAMEVVTHVLLLDTMKLYVDLQFLIVTLLLTLADKDKFQLQQKLKTGRLYPKMKTLLSNNSLK